MMRTIEELSMNAWPGLQTMNYDGWILRFANGYTRRANSVIPLYPSKNNPVEKIGFCEKVYGDQGLPTIFKMTAASEPHELDLLLSERSYRAEALTTVQLLGLARLVNGGQTEVDLASLETEDWHAAFCRMNGIGLNQQETHRQIVSAIVPKKCFAAVRLSGQVVGCGLGVLQDGMMGLFDIIVDKAHRRQKYGDRIVRALLDWGKQGGAQMAYLQVMCNNPPALGLYAGIGFREEYQYWYRVKP
jgi:ribosomal protein S18 acetylase RimI-like enzyme